MERAWLAAWLALAVPAFAAGEKVTFPGPGIELAGRLYRPTGDGPFPAMVLMHGCAGMWRQDGQEPTAAYDFWAEHWRNRGYAALLVDSFGSRGEKEICTQKDRTVSPVRDRPRDAYASLEWLASRKDIDPQRIHLMGWSNGAMAVLNTIKADAPGRPEKGPEFRSATAFYPGCAALERGDYRTVVPLLIQTGANDDWTPARPCESLVGKAKAKGASMEIDVYPDAHHAFDGYGKVRSRPEVRNTASPTGWGATVGADFEARNQAIRRTTAWVDARNR